MPNYGIALFQKPEVEGLDRDDILILYGLVNNFHLNEDAEVYPIELYGTVCSAMGFITREAADVLDYDYEASGLHNFIASILDNTENERADHHYIFKGIDIFLC